MANLNKQVNYFELRGYVKYAGYIDVICWSTLLSANLLSYNNVLDKSNTAMINSLEMDNLAEGLTNGNGTRAAVPSINDNLQISYMVKQS